MGPSNSESRDDEDSTASLSLFALGSWFPRSLIESDVAVTLLLSIVLDALSVAILCTNTGISNGI